MMTNTNPASVTWSKETRVTYGARYHGLRIFVSCNSFELYEEQTRHRINTSGMWRWTVRHGSEPLANGHGSTAEAAKSAAIKWIATTAEKI
jgi:hypothetical protein